MDHDFLLRKIEERQNQNAFRSLRLPANKIDFCSNDYLGIVHNKLIEQLAMGNKQWETTRHGSTGSRLLSGNYELIEETERVIADFHQAESALIFNSGYDANIGLLSCVPQRDDTIIYDYLSHASIRDGVRLSLAQSFSFEHNNLNDLEKKLQLGQRNIFVVTESVFSMDGDKAPLGKMLELCRTYNAHLIVDEAHATGVIGKKGEGQVQLLGIQKYLFARIHTFGKAVGAHGAVVLGSSVLRDYLINFCRPFIYTTALPESSIASIRTAYELFPEMHDQRNQLDQLINQFRESTIGGLSDRYQIIKSETPIQAVIIPGNSNVKSVADNLQSAGFDVRAILYPTVPKGSERLRIVLHSFNTSSQLERLISLLP